MSETENTTEAETPTQKKERGTNERFYIDQSGAITRRYGEETEDCDLSEAPSNVYGRLASEGYIRLRQTGKTHADIIGGRAFPDRQPPVGKVRAGPGPWVQAIAAVKAKDMEKAAKSSGAKITPSEREGFATAALSWAQSLTKDQQASLRKHKLVKMAHADITGESGSLDDALGAFGNDAQHDGDVADMSQAAD